MNKSNSKRRMKVGTCTLHKQHLKSALSSFKKHSFKAKRQALAKKCGKEDNKFYKSSSVITPFSHTYVMLELRKCFLRHNWTYATKLLLMLLDGGTLSLKRVMLKESQEQIIPQP
ncbi:hypothetical protein L798_14451 [Zootermopsis nevadensis]|uniref:Uncharacterized protein n=1 Tax=Zootermopsis nevadensis TaxID=136037 RepID=A0A067R0G7_ZOONE|nr:hypothetical protein L798_14451 [Zootermopsis nevadensis]